MLGLFLTFLSYVEYSNSGSGAITREQPLLQCYISDIFSMFNNQTILSR
ncbi:hypothetical protein QWZ13_15500 [Reinekea marina]|nr:hypothetical protein [Reinekea marina]MDN3650314.1 hypothetical protein [Reinekea marina]